MRRLTLRYALAWVVGFSCLLGIESAHAQDRNADAEDPYFAAKLMLGVAGEGEIEFDGLAGAGGEGDLEVTYGAGLQYQHPLHEFFSLGGQLSLRSWQSEVEEDAPVDVDRNLLFDISLVPAGRYMVDHDVELYLAIPVGLALDFPGDDGFAAGGAASAEVNTGVGLNLAFMLGARFTVSEGFGLLAELGYQLHSFSHELEAMAAGVTTSTEFDVSLGQVAINVGVFLD